MTNTVTYRAQTPVTDGQQWLAYVVMPNGKLWMIVSFGATEEEAKSKIITLWESERAKVRISEGAEPDTTNDPWQADRRGHHLAGLVWVVFKKDRTLKKRVAPGTAEGLIASGEWERGGPRSK